MIVVLEYLDPQNQDYRPLSTLFPGYCIAIEFPALRLF